MTSTENLSDYNRGLELAQAGEYVQAMECIDRHLSENPVDAEALNDAGVILHCLRRDDEAIGRFLRSRAIDKRNVQTLLNLTEAYIASGKIEEMLGILDQLENENLLNPDMLNRAANRALETDKKLEAVELLLKSVRIWPEQKVLVPMIEIIRSQMPKIAFVSNAGAMQSGLAGVYGYLKDRYCTRFADADATAQADAIGDCADIVWLNNCPDVLRKVSAQKRNYKVVADLTKCQISAAEESRIGWENIDLVFADQELVLTEAAADRVVELMPGYDDGYVRFVERQRGKNIVCFDSLNAENNPMMLVQCMQKLSYLDREYKLYFAGASVSYSVERYLRNMISRLQIEDVILFERPKGDVEKFLENKHFVVSGCCDGAGIENVLFGMACGLKPLVHNFPGSGSIAGDEHVFNIAEDFCNMVFDRVYEPKRYRNLAEKISKDNGKFTKIKHAMKRLTEPAAEYDAEYKITETMFANMNLPK